MQTLLPLNVLHRCGYAGINCPSRRKSGFCRHEKLPRRENAFRLAAFQVVTANRAVECPPPSQMRKQLKFFRR